ncbi:MAG: hypothetical protein WBA34_06630, partial [Candidatus Deferrimicrobiaceae bacterium]
SLRVRCMPLDSAAISGNLFNRDFRTVPYEAQFDQLSSRENGKSHGYNQLADACIDGPYIK